MYTIGQLASLTGLPVKTIRFYSDEGILPPAGRTAAGYRLYGDEDRARLELVRMLRGVGFDLPTIRALVERDLPVDQAVALHLAAVENQLKTLRVARAVLRRAQARGSVSAADLGRLATLARLNEAERARLVAGFWRAAAGDAPVDEDWLRCMADASIPDLPEDPPDEILDAWLELAELATDAGFVAALREQAAAWWADRPPGAELNRHRDQHEALIDDVEAALAAGIAPGDPAARPLVDRLVELTAATEHRAADTRLRAELRDRFATHDPRAERWWRLVAVLRGWPDPEPMVAPYRWLGAALEANVL